MAKTVCSVCGKSKATLQCGLCQTDLCKNCTQFLDDGEFAWMITRPEELSHTAYCETCFTAKVAGPLQNYQDLVEKAKHVLVFEKSQGKETRLIKRIEKPISVLNCADHDEAVMRLAFQAAQGNFNAIVDMDLKSTKIRNGKYQTSSWSGTAIPVNLTEGQLVKDRSIWSNPN